MNSADTSLACQWGQCEKCSGWECVCECHLPEREADYERVTSLGGDDYDGPLTSGGSDGTYAENH